MSGDIPFVLTDESRVPRVRSPPHIQLAGVLESLPGFTGMMTVLAQRNLRRGLALGLPSGQGAAKLFGVTALTPAQLSQGLPPDEVAALNDQNGVLMNWTPLWYYILRESAVLHGGA
jgi:hypothetical protein